MIDGADARSIAPATPADREAIGDANLVAQATFWAREHENNPGDAEAAANLSNVTRRLGNAERAAQIANQALALAPENVELLRALGAALIENNRAPAAVEPLRRASTIDRRDTRALNLLGVALDQTNQHDAAREVYERAIEIDETNTVALTNLGLSHALSGDPATAETYLRRAAALPGADIRVRMNLALAVALQGRYDEAETIALQDLSPEEAAENMAYIRAMTRRTTTRESASLLRGAIAD